MSFDLASIQELVLAHFGSHGIPSRMGGVEDPDLEALIQDAVAFYSLIKPDTAFFDEAGDGAAYDFAVPSDWQDGFSAVVSVEYPQGDRIPTFLDMLEVTPYDDTGGTVIRLQATTPASGKTARITYTRLHILGTEATGTTIADSDKEALGHLATHRFAMRMAAEAAKLTPSAIRDDPVGFRSQTNEYLRVAEQHLSMFYDLLGVPADSRQPAASVAGEIPNTMSWGRPPLTHGQGTSRFLGR